MKGFNNDPLVERLTTDVDMVRFNVMVRVHDETPMTELHLPDQAKDLLDHTSGRHGTIVGMGDRVEDSMTAEGLLEMGSHVIFDESISIDDPNRCFRCAGQVYAMFEVGTIICVLKEATPETIAKELEKGEVLCAIGHHLIWVLGDKLVASRPVMEEAKTDSGLIIPTGDWLKEVGNIKFKGGKYARQTGGVIEVAGKGQVRDISELDGAFKRLSMDLKAGDHILFPKYGHTDIEIDGIPCVVMAQDKVLATFKPKEREERLHERKGKAVHTA